MTVFIEGNSFNRCFGGASNPEKRRGPVKNRIGDSVAILRQKFAQSIGLPFASILPESKNAPRRGGQLSKTVVLSNSDPLGMAVSSTRQGQIM